MVWNFNPCFFAVRLAEIPDGPAPIIIKSFSLFRFDGSDLTIFSTASFPCSAAFFISPIPPNSPEI